MNKKSNSFNSARRSVLSGAGLALMAVLGGLPATAYAQDAWPNKPIRLVVPFTPGGVTDTSGRLIAEYLGKRLGQQIIVDNKPGASGNIGTSLVKAAPPDGYTPPRVRYASRRPILIPEFRPSKEKRLQNRSSEASYALLSTRLRQLVCNDISAVDWVEGLSSRRDRRQNDLHRRRSRRYGEDVLPWDGLRSR